MLKSAFWTQLGSKNTVRTARTRHKAIAAEWFVYIHGTEVGRPDWKQCQWIDKQLPIYWWACLDRRTTSTVACSFQPNFWSIYQLQQRVLRPFTITFHARVSWTFCYSSRAHLWSQLLWENSAVNKYISNRILIFSLALGTGMHCRALPTASTMMKLVMYSSQIGLDHPG